MLTINLTMPPPYLGATPPLRQHAEFAGARAERLRLARRAGQGGRAGGPATDDGLPTVRSAE